MPASTAEHRAWAFGEFTLDLDRGALLRDGADVHMRPKSFAVLTHLVERHGRLVTKEELLTAVWGHTSVTEGALTQVMIDLRRALGDEGQRMIRTVPRRGYLFDVPVARMDGAPPATPEATAAGLPLRPAEPSEAASPRLAWRLALAVGLILAALGLWWGVAGRSTGLPAPDAQAPASPAGPSIAVLPFLDLSPENDQAWFSDGLAEEVLNVLAQVPGLRVVARTSSFSFRDRNVDVATIARRLDVDHVLEGSVRKWGNRVRVTAQLVETWDSSHRWSETYDRDLDDIFVIQDEIAASVAAALKLAMTADPGHDGGTHDARALEHYLQGRYFHWRRAPDDLARAREAFQHAVERDPAYGRAWAGLAGALQIGLMTRELPWDEKLPRWREAVEQALALAPDFPDTLYRAAMFYWATGQVDRAQEYHRKFAQTGPENPLVLGSAAGRARDEGRLEEAIELARRAVELDPVAAVSHNNLGDFLVCAGRYDEARAVFDQALALSPAYERTYETKTGYLLLLERRYPEALARIEAWAEGEKRDVGLAMVYGALGRGAEAAAALDRLKALPGPEAARSVAEVHAHAGTMDEAFEWLETARARAGADPHPMALRILVSSVEDSWFLGPLQDDPRWDAWKRQ